jgi:hypothetical protein
MRKFGFTFLAVTIFGWLLALMAFPALAYYPPLQATLFVEPLKVGVTYKVDDPKRGHVEYSAKYWENTVVDCKQDNGVMAWIFHHPTGVYYVIYCVYDPFQGGFIEDAGGPFTQVSQLTVQDGVVAYAAPEPGAVPGARYATYDPIKGWQHRTWLQDDGFTNLRLVGNKDGVVLRLQDLDSPSIIGKALEADIYDAALGRWDNHILFADQEPYNSLLSYGISNATITITYNSMVYGLVTETHGYDYSLEDWYLGYTKPMAYFVAQPTSGPAPLWVWFTDMSIAGTTWNWYFGDSGSSTSRSPYHSYQHRGSYWVGQSVNNAASIFGRNINVRPAVIVGPLLPLLLQ